VRFDVEDDDPGTYSVVLSQFDKTRDVSYTLNAYCTAPFAFAMAPPTPDKVDEIKVANHEKRLVKVKTEAWKLAIGKKRLFADGSCRFVDVRGRGMWARRRAVDSACPPLCTTHNTGTHEVKHTR
jgi:hypothetical protein